MATQNGYIKVRDAKHLKHLVVDENRHDFFIQLNLGFRSSKTIDYNEEADKFEIVNEIDNSTQLLSAEELFNENLTNIGKAIGYGSFFAYNY